MEITDGWDRLVLLKIALTRRVLTGMTNSSPRWAIDRVDKTKMQVNPDDVLRAVFSKQWIIFYRDTINVTDALYTIPII